MYRMVEDIQIENIPELINGFLNYCNADKNLTEKQKLNFLKEKKIQLEVDNDICYDKASKTKDITQQNQYLKRMEINEMAIFELNICINYLNAEIRNNSFKNKIHQKIFKKLK